MVHIQVPYSFESLTEVICLIFKGYNLDGFSGQFFRFFFFIKWFCFLVAIFDLVHYVEAIHDLC